MSSYERLKSTSLAAAQQPRQVVRCNCREVDPVVKLKFIELKDSRLAQGHQCFKLLLSMVINLACPYVYYRTCMVP